MEKKNLIKVFLPVMALVFVFSGCENNEENQQQKINEGSSEKQAMQNNSSEEYQVDSSDMLNSGRLIDNLAKQDLSEMEKNGLIQMRE